MCLTLPFLREGAGVEIRAELIRIFEDHIKYVFDANFIGVKQRPGELWVRGPNVMKGYYPDPIATAKVLVDGWLNIGDIARIDSDGALFIVGRTKELIIRSGFNVYPVKVEIMSSLPAAAIGKILNKKRKEMAQNNCRVGKA